MVLLQRSSRSDKVSSFFYFKGGGWGGGAVSLSSTIMYLRFLISVGRSIVIHGIVHVYNHC